MSRAASRSRDANVNDVEIGRQVPIQAGTTYVFDKGYCRFDWWQKINDSKAFFVTRPKTRIRLRAVKHRTIRKRKGDGFKIIADDEVKLVSKGDSRLPIPLRRINVRRDNGGVITLLTNDLDRTAVEIAALYKSRWQIELLFRWIKQHLDIRKFLGNNDNAIRLQVLAAMIAYLLLRIAARTNRIAMPASQAGRTRQPVPVHASIHRRHRQAAARQPQPPPNPETPPTRWSSAMSEFPRTALHKGRGGSPPLPKHRSFILTDCFAAPNRNASDRLDVSANLRRKCPSHEPAGSQKDRRLADRRREVGVEPARDGGGNLRAAGAGRLAAVARRHLRSHAASRYSRPSISSGSRATKSSSAPRISICWIRRDFSTARWRSCSARAREVRHRIDDPESRRFPFLDDMRAEGVTDYIALPLLLHRRHGSRHRAGPPGSRAASATSNWTACDR